MSTTRGIRNNNPGNIEYSPLTPWQGLAEPPTDGRFCRFGAMPYGVRAMARTLINYQDKHGLRTVRSMIARWAPPHENATARYAAFVARAMAVEPDASINVHEYETLRPMIAAMIDMECGALHGVSDAQIDKGLALAGVEPQAKPLSQSRTVRGGQVAAGATVAGAVAEIAEQAETIKGALEPLQEYLPWVKFAVAGLALFGIGWMVWARIDDARRLAR
jgi:hypothetical protein